MRQLYLDQCSKCHGENGTPTAVGKIGKAPAFADPQWTVPLERAVESIRNGKGRGSSRMPDFKRLGTESIRGLAEYVLSMKQS
jgi:mono/diheme cytochrome c family protein